MAAHNYHVLMLEDHASLFTGVLVEDDAGCAVGPSRQAVLDQLEEYVQWMKRKRYYPDAALNEPTVTWFTVPVRPTYQKRTQLFACDETVSLRVACVHGKRDNGMLYAAVPTMGVAFFYHAAEKLKPLVEHHVKEKLGTIAPRELTRFFPPRDVTLCQITVKSAAPSNKPATHEEMFPGLSAVAEALGERDLRRQFSKPWEREREISSLISRIGKERASVILLGPGGVGKTTLLAEAVRRIEHDTSQKSEPARKHASEDDEPAPPRRHRFWITQANRLIAGMRYLGQWEERCEQIISELSACEGTLCIENLLELLRVGGSGAGDSIAAFFMPYLQRGELRLVGECTAEELAPAAGCCLASRNCFRFKSWRPSIRRRHCVCSS